jgi:hypothetical protein
MKTHPHLALALIGSIGLHKLAIEDASNDPKSVDTHADEKVVGHEDGRAKGRDLKEIAEKHDVDLSSLLRESSKGIKVEFEHTKDPVESQRITMDHLAEHPDYYKYLADMEDRFSKAGFVRGYTSGASKNTQPQGSSATNPHEGEAPAQVDGRGD